MCALLRLDSSCIYHSIETRVTDLTLRALLSRSSALDGARQASARGELGLLCRRQRRREWAGARDSVPAPTVSKGVARRLASPGGTGMERRVPPLRRAARGGRRDEADRHAGQGGAPARAARQRDAQTIRIPCPAGCDTPAERAVGEDSRRHPDDPPGGALERHPREAPGRAHVFLADIVRLEAQVARFASVDSSSAPRLSSHHLASIDALQANFDAVRQAITDAAIRTSVAPRDVDDSSAQQSSRQAHWPAESATARDQSQSNRAEQDRRSAQLETVPREHAHVTSDSRYASLSDPSDHFMANRAHSPSLTRLRSSDSHPSDTRRSNLPPHRPFSPLREQYQISYNVPRHSYGDRYDAPAAQDYSSRLGASVPPTSVHEQGWVPSHDSRSERLDGNFASVPHSLDDSINTQRSDERHRRGQVHDLVGAANASAPTRAQSHYAANASVFLEGKGKQGKYRVPGGAPR